MLQKLNLLKKCQQKFFFCLCNLIKIGSFCQNDSNISTDFESRMWVLFESSTLWMYPILYHSIALQTVSFDWFLSGLGWILKLEFCFLKLFIFYQKSLWNVRSRINSSTFWVSEPVFIFVWSKLKLFAQKMKILIKYI